MDEVIYSSQYYGVTGLNPFQVHPTLILKHICPLLDFIKTCPAKIAKKILTGGENFAQHSVQAT